MKARNILLGIVLLLGVLIFTACGGNDSSDQNEESSTDSEGNNEEQAAAADGNYPEHEVEIIVPNAAGGSNDLVARSISRELQDKLGASVVVRNEDGAGGSIARSQVYGEEPDGYTILTSPMPSMSIGEVVKGDDFKVLDFEPIYGLFGKNSTTIAVPTDSQFETLDDLVEASKNESLKVAGTGAATNSTLASILLQESGIDHEYVPFEGDAGASTQVAGGHVDFGLISEAGAESMVNEGEMRILGYLGEERSELYPDAPTLAESGFENATFEIIYGFFAPPETPDEIITVLEDAFEEASEEESFQKTAEDSGFIIDKRNAEEFGEAIQESHSMVEELQDSFELE
ncbi:tripartite tricarboxylate transporter substrate binding protein [Alteribacillus sp. YIM 98480]|uniref:Bug family tripartite tricarboxylate transporter substrate binding protein n=1 Tax=Alteribacillus sp. YIM 98480 TaxID=2606599 RepID=UPI00131DC7C0|nr:tripartite tricarboxylate transporter substrate binding protein [Alteribacillus sp. YIM 98480]